MRKTDIILAGVGGQGILTIAAALGYASLAENLHVKQSEVHGMSQRGGAVQSHFRISEKPVASDLIPSGYADLILSVEPMESLRYLPYLCEEGWLVTNSVPFVNISQYPDIEKIKNAVTAFPKHIWIDADAIAKGVGSVKYSNMVMLGAAASFIHLNTDSLRKGIRMIFRKKGEEMIEANLVAFEAGLAEASGQLS